MIKNYTCSRIDKEELLRTVTDLTNSAYVAEGIKVLIEREPLPVTLTYGTKVLRIYGSEYDLLYNLEFSHD